MCRSWATGKKYKLVTQKKNNNNKNLKKITTWNLIISQKQQKSSVYPVEIFQAKLWFYARILINFNYLV